MLDALRLDGRATYAQLAAATGSSAAQAGRRLEALLDDGTVYLDIEVAHELLGFSVSALIWMTVAPGDLDAVGRAVAEHAESSFVAAVSGAHNLFASVRARDLDELYGYVTTELGALPGIRQLELSPVLRTVKQAGAVMDGLRLPDPTRR